MKPLLRLVALFICVTAVECQERNTLEERCIQQLQRGVKVPFYFGTSNLACVKNLGKGKRRRSVDTVSVTRLTHRYLYYCGSYYEFGTGYPPYRTLPYGWYRCNPETDSEPAGYSNAYPDCSKSCADKYVRQKPFSTLNNNCHHFANAMAKYLYRSDKECCKYRLPY
ncbi:uncharacterized protein LOC127839325 [Dreissena polymorpha]|uniref:Uncharacterized protein n=1 Tax=Dreissena polymorpha TaxID=45954 RepID=A0A9D4J5R5_DREPO|nr:uncharacterized protein LOC127839325 [Dreissena polymorpha]KAH3800826.1 hypothetical protein DPMN_154469 [Dreissena polymorpha]